MSTAVLPLYKSILRLHRHLPIGNFGCLFGAELRVLGDKYVRDEFKRHKTAKPEFVPGFVQEW